MDRVAIAREQRRRQAHEALEYERERATSLEAQLESVVAELEGPQLDEAALAQLEPEDAELARSALGLGDADGPEEEWLELEGVMAETDPEDARAAAEQEIARLEEEITSTRRCQEALERFIEALGA